jgi:hypothetical protein
VICTTGASEQAIDRRVATVAITWDAGTRLVHDRRRSGSGRHARESGAATLGAEAFAGA